MSVPLTIPVSMPHHYSNRFFGGNGSPSGGQPPGAPPQPSTLALPTAATVSSVLMAPPPSLAVASVSGMQPAVHGEHRTMPVRKQSVFEAPTGLSALRRASSRSSSSSLNYVLTPPSPPPPSESTAASPHLFSSSGRYLSSASPPDSWSSSSGSSHPLDLSGETSSSVIHYTSSASTAASRLVAPSKEELSQHISRIIHENNAVVGSFEGPFLGRNHSSGGFYYSRRSMSTTVQPSPSLVQSVITSSGARASLGQQYQFAAYQPQQQQQSSPLDSIRRFSSDVAGSQSSYSRLQSALEGKAAEVVPPPPPAPASTKVHPGRKYSEIPYRQQAPHPESFKYPLNQASYLHQHPKSALKHKHSMILGGHEHLLDVLPALNESSRSNSEPSLVRNLLTSKTSPFAHLVGSDLAASTTSAASTSASSQQSDSSIIKDLLLKSRATSQVEAPAASLFSRSTPSPNKRTRTESASYDPTVTPQLGSSSMFTCKLCRIPFRNRQNLEVHQKIYCRGSEAARTSGTDSLPERLGAKRSHQEMGYAAPIPERKVSVLERPSIITYSSDSPLSSLSTMSLNSASSEQQQQQQSAQQPDDASFGNILKSKLLAQESDSYMTAPLKKRKISEPAFRYHDSKHRDSFIKPHRLSIMQPPVFHRHDRSSEHQLEILPAYMPYLQSRSVKITVKSPVLFPVLQDLLDTGTNHEFIVDDSPTVSSTFVPVIDLEDELPSSSEAKSPETQENPLVRSSLAAEDAESKDLKEVVSQLLEEVCAKVAASQSAEGEGESGDHSTAVTECLSDLVDSVTTEMTVPAEASPALSVASLAPSLPPQKKTSPARPTTLDLGRSYDQSARNQREVGTTVEHIRKISRLSIFVNRCSHQDEDGANKNQLVASTLISPDTPRAKRKYQQLYINGNAYTNLGLKVNPRPTYCCIYRLQPMFVTQDANPQLSMYSQWKVMPVPAGDILEQVGSPHELLSAYNSSEAVFAVSRSRLSLMEVATAATMGGIEVDPEETDAESAPPALPEIVKPTGTVTRDFLDKVSARLTNYMSSNLPVRPDPEADQFASPFPSRRYERTLQAALVSLGDGFSSRLSDTCSRSQYILTHSSYHRLSTQARTQQQRIRKRSRTHNVDFYKAPVPGKSTDMVVATSAISSASSSSNSTYLSQSEQASRLPLTPESSSIKLPEMSIAKPRKRSSTTSVMSATSLSSSTFSPFLTMHPMLGHLPAKSKQTVMYIMMMGQAPMSMSVPTVSSLATSKNMASRKFSECIGMKPNAIEENWAARIAADGSTEMVPKRIKIFEGGFKSNEDYTYVRGRGRGKYVCEECGIRCKKPSMLKKHIRTHTDLRPYSCRHCAFAFKTKGNLTKHMKSKAHHKKCVELGIIPVPTSIDDSQIDNDALAKQEQYELTCGSTGGLNQFADEDDDGDDDYDEEEYDDEDEEDDEGVPIPLIEQQRLTYIVPGQFDDADGPPEDSSAEASTPKAPPSHKSSDGSSTLSAAAFSPRPKLSLCSLSGVTASIVSCASTVTSTVSTLSPASSTLPLSITDIRPAVLLGEENDKYSGSLLSHHRKISSSSSRSSSSTGLPPSGPYLATSNITAGSKMIVSGSSSNLPAPRADRLATPPSQQQPLRQAATCALQSYHFGQAAASASAISAPSSSSGEPNKDRHLPGNQHSRSSTTSLSPPASITKEHEAEAARSLLILSGVSAPNSDNSSSLGGANSSGIFSIAKSPSNVAAALSTTGDSSENVHHRSPLAKKKHSSALLEYQQQHSNERGLAERVADNSEVLLLKAAERRISYEVASDHVLLASQQSQQQQQLHQQQQMAAESRQSPIEMMRRISANSQKVPDRRTSQPTSVIISRASPTESLEAYEYRRKRSRHERSISESATSSAHAQQQHLHLAEQFAAGHPGRPLSPKSQYLLSISSLITSSPTAAQFVSTTNSTMPPAGQFVSPNSAAAAAAAAQQLLHQQYANLGIRNPRAALIAEEIKRAANIANSNETAIQQQQMNALLLQQQHHQRMPTGVINAHSPPGALTRDSALQGANDAASNTETNSVFAQQQKLMAKFYETFKQQQQQPPAVQQAAPKHFPAANTLPYPGAFVLSSAELAAAKAQLGITTNGHSQLKVPTIQQPPSISPNLSYLVPSTASTEMAKKAFEKEPKRKSPLSFQERDMSPPQQQLPSAASRHFGNATANVPLPPPPASPLPAPVTFEPAKSTASAASDESDQPMDLSKTSALTVPEVAIHPPARDPSPHESLYSPLKAASVSSLSPPNVTLTPEQQQRQRQPSPVSPSQQLANVLAAAQQQNSPGRQRFRPMQEDKHLTEQLVRAFSPLNPDVNPMSFARSPTTNGRELYKNLRSEEFAHLSPGVHTPNRLPQNMMLLGSRNSAGPSASATSPSSTAGPSGSQGPIARTPNSIPNGYTTAEGKSVCTICMKQFSKPSQLRLHINIHFFERPFRCDSCAVSFRTKGHLQKHSRSVSHLNKLNMNITFGRPSTDNPRPFKCSDCKIAFRIHGHLAKHLRSKMHIMKLECLGKLPFGMFAEMERSNINLTPIDTTDCEKALESLRSLAQKLYDPRQMTWQVTESLNMDDVIEEDIDDELDEEGYPDEDMDMGESIGGSVAHLMTAESPEQDSNEDSTSGPLLTREPVASAVPLEVISTEQSNSSHSTASPPPASTQGASSSGIASTRSNTCHLCGRTFKAAKFLQVHLYTDHCDDAESATSDPAVSSV